MRSPARRTHIDMSKRGSVIIRYITVTGGRVVRRIIVHGLVGSLLDINSYISNQKIHALTSYANSCVSVVYNFDHLDKKSVRFSINPSHLIVFIKPLSMKLYSKLYKLGNKPLEKRKHHKKRKTQIVLHYICNHHKLLYSKKIRNTVGRLFSISPYITDNYISTHINKYVTYDHVNLSYPKRFLNHDQLVNIYLSTVKPPKNMGKIVIHYHYPQINRHKTVTSYAQIGTYFNLHPYCDSLEINHNISVDHVCGLFKMVHISGNATKYMAHSQSIDIYTKEHSIEISISVPQTIIESLERYIHYGSGPYLIHSEGPIDINRSSLIRYLMSAYGDEMTRQSYILVGKICRADPSHRYITLKTMNTHIIRRKGDRLSRLVCAMVREKIPIMSFKHYSNGQLLRDKKGQPIVKQLYYPSKSIRK